MNGYATAEETRPAILDTATLLADTTRCRILQILEDQELTVSELCSILQLPQSTVSRHLRILADDQWVQSRRDGTSNLYRPVAVNGAAGSLWRLIREQLSSNAAVQRDRLRLKGVLRERISRSEQFFASSAGEWDRLRDDLFGPRFDLLAMAWLLGSDLTVGDLACGTGRVAEALAPAVGKVLAIDQSEGMLEAAHRRLDDFENVELREGRLESLPIADHTLDVAALFLALHLSPDPLRVLSEARRVLRPGGRLLVVDLLPHAREELRQEMGHVWLGFSQDQMAGYLQPAGFSTASKAFRYSPLPAVPASTGPGLFVAVAQTSEKPH